MGFWVFFFFGSFSWLAAGLLNNGSRGFFFFFGIVWVFFGRVFLCV